MSSLLYRFMREIVKKIRLRHTAPEYVHNMPACPGRCGKEEYNNDKYRGIMRMGKETGQTPEGLP